MLRSTKYEENDLGFVEDSRLVQLCTCVRIQILPYIWFCDFLSLITIPNNQLLLHVMFLSLLSMVLVRYLLLIHTIFTPSYYCYAVVFISL